MYWSGTSATKLDRIEPLGCNPIHTELGVSLTDYNGVYFWVDMQTSGLFDTVNRFLMSERPQTLFSDILTVQMSNGLIYRFIWSIASCAPDNVRGWCFKICHQKYLFCEGGKNKTQEQTAPPCSEDKSEQQTPSLSHWRHTANFAKATASSCGETEGRPQEPQAKATDH